ncbi:MAG: hypothetical protein K8R31_12580 [Bacteroidales bacterium]|nr:hypothetical protein [Bacteroidales bacterium]
MKNLLLTLKTLAALLLLITFYGSLYSQNVISSVNVSDNAAVVGKLLTNNTYSSIVLEKDADNWTTNKNYLDNSSSNFIYYVMIAMNEKVYEFDKEIENWMLNDSEWILPKSDFDNTVEELNLIEDWMLNDDFWRINDDVWKINDDVDRNTIEDWMLDDKFWVMVK